MLSWKRMALVAAAVVGASAMVVSPAWAGEPTAVTSGDFEAVEAIEDLGDDAAIAAAPKFQAPFKCGQKWKGTTYNGHWPNTNSRDFWRSGGATKGQPVLAAAAGKVIEAKYGSRQGWGVSMDMGGGYKTYYFHLTAKPKVKNGQKVKQGQLLGYVGDTGQAKGSPHLHYTVTKDGKGIKPVFNGKTHQPNDVITSKNSC
ncbi:M23 family metallopeptidase [Saccharothrix obliqua]|uniref:M23 family metallopeptidase n=1 Tax=Saccharothrix obliqua TaxID=2861747 RepID=UPI001C5CEAEA|nr:M23 family metallopeptidase [Saccharothrix obliqua]MBW4717910.1 M23 family metallopeptidase [Saccharothrix obliqua]